MTESGCAAAVSMRAIPKLAVRRSVTCARVASASRVTKAPSNVSADATTRSNRFIQFFTGAAKMRFDRRGNVTAYYQISKSRFWFTRVIFEQDETRLIPADEG